MALWFFLVNILLASQYRLNLHFCHQLSWTSFHMINGHFCFFFWTISSHLLPIFHWITVLFFFFSSKSLKIGKVTSLLEIWVKFSPYFVISLFTLLFVCFAVTNNWNFLKWVHGISSSFLSTGLSLSVTVFQNSS